MTPYLKGVLRYETVKSIYDLLTGASCPALGRLEAIYTASQKVRLPFYQPLAARSSNGLNSGERRGTISFFLKTTQTTLISLTSQTTQFKTSSKPVQNRRSQIDDKPAVAVRVALWRVRMNSCCLGTLVD